MKNIFEDAINRGGYDLTKMLKKIDTYHIEGKLTDAERDELYSYARGKQVNQYNVNEEIEKLWKAVRELQNSSKVEDDLNTDSDTGEEEVWNEFVQPTGAHDAYQSGDKVTYNGKKYVCVMDNCVYTPDVYPAGWEEVTE